MIDPCPHCGAVSEGTLMGFPVIKHKQGCPKAPTGIKSIDIAKMISALPPPRKFMCVGCGVEWDEVGEAEHKHAVNCPCNPLRN